MTKSDHLTVALVQQVLDRGFQECMEIASRMYGQLESIYQGRVEHSANAPESLRSTLQQPINELYHAVATTLFTLLHVLQPDDFKKTEPVNFYFLPGYHSCLLRRRVFIRHESSDFGIGISGFDINQFICYYYCCHASWYHFATKPDSDWEMLPASPYHWFGYQEPRISDKPHDLVASLTFSTAPWTADKEYPEHWGLELSSLPGSSVRWGEEVAGVLNEMPHRHDPTWVFPDRQDRGGFKTEQEESLRRIRCLLISLWMHAVFEGEEPTWWDELYAELDKQKLPKLKAMIDRARRDKTATDWADKSTKRAQYKVWTTIALHKLVAPPPDRIEGSRRQSTTTTNARIIYPQTIGWATFLSSVTLGLPFISVARHWVRSVYGMLRTAEVGVLLRERDVLQRATEAIKNLPHDTHKLVSETNMLLRKEIAQVDATALLNRRYALLKLEAYTLLGYTLSHAARDRTKAVLARQTMLRHLAGVGKDLVGVIHRVVEDIQEVEGEAEVPKVKYQKLLPANFEIPWDTYGTVLMLVGEMVRNFCEHSPDDQTELMVNHTADQLVISLDGHATYAAEGQAFNLLNNMLDDVLKVGGARLTDLGSHRYTWTVFINLNAEAL